MVHYTAEDLVRDLDEICEKAGVNREDLIPLSKAALIAAGFKKTLYKKYDQTLDIQCYSRSVFEYLYSAFKTYPKDYTPLSLYLDVPSAQGFTFRFKNVFFADLVLSGVRVHGFDLPMPKYISRYSLITHNNILPGPRWSYRYAKSYRRSTERYTAYIEARKIVKRELKERRERI